MKRIILTIFFLISISTYVFAAQKKFVYDDHNRRDPLWRLVTNDGVILNYGQDLLIIDMIIEGIIYDTGGKSLAIINGAVVKQNDKIGLFVVTKIERKKVILRKGQENYVLELKKEE